MKKNLLCLAAIAAMIFGSCSSEEVVGPTVLDDEAGAISFGTFLDRSPQAPGSGIKPLGAVTNIGTVQGSGFTVLAYSTSDDDWSTYVTTAPAAPNFMDDQLVTWNTDKWEYSPIKYWPKVGSAYGYVTFFGFNAATGAAADGVAGSNPKITFTTQDAASAQVDLVADVVEDKKGDDSPNTVKFDFDHILSRIAFKAKTAGNYGTDVVKVTSLRVYYKTGEVAKEGVYTFHVSNNKDGGNWTPSTTVFFTEITTPGDGDPVYTNASGLSLTGTAATLGGSTPNYLMLIPQTVALGDVYVELTYTVDGVPNTVTLDLPAITWAPGTAYTYTFNITLDAVVFDEIDVNDWGTESDINVDVNG
jgi:hypothetical protein